MIDAREGTKADVKLESGSLAAALELEIRQCINEMNRRILPVIEYWN